MKTSQLTGGCLCGAVRYAVSGQPYHVTYCHCLDCRRSSGAPLVTWASVARPALAYLRGGPRLIPWADRIRGFCDQCGTPLVFLASESAAEIDFAVCTLDQPEQLIPEDHTWVEDKLPWIQISDDLPKFVRSRQL